jgi:PucR family transcriptional regulator, purine catabolism regulatory protein
MNSVALVTDPDGVRGSSRNGVAGRPGATLATPGADQARSGIRAPQGGGSYTIGDLLSDSQLNLELLTGGPEALATPLRGAHSIELEHPAQWLDSGWMMLTVGVRLRNKPEAQRALVAELDELGASCLGFGVGVSFKSVPPALLDEARARNFPVILVPEEIQFREITRAVFHSTVGIEATAFQRLSALQRNLTRAFADDKPLESIVQRLGRLVNATVAVVSLDGKVDAATGPLSVVDFADELSAQTSFPMASAQTARYRISAAPVTRATGGAGRWLVVASQNGAAGEEFVRAALQVTAPLVDGLLRMTQTRRGQDLAIGKALLDSSLDESASPTERRTLGARMAAIGIGFAGEFGVSVLRHSSADCGQRSDDPLGDVENWLHDRFDANQVGYLLSRRGDELVLVSTLADVGDIVAGIHETWPMVDVGVGRSIACDGDIPTSHRDATIAVQHLGLRTGDRLARFADLDVVTQLLAEVPADRFAATAGPIADLLRENPIQLEALRAYFVHNRDVKAAADAIFLHPNTLRYRLERLEQTLGRSLREPAVTASLYCVLTLIGDWQPEISTQREATSY